VRSSGYSWYLSALNATDCTMSRYGKCTNELNVNGTDHRCDTTNLRKLTKEGLSIDVHMLSQRVQ